MTLKFASTASAALLLAGLAVSGAQAAAAQATLRFDGDTLIYTAAPGVANWPFVSSLTPETLRIEDSNESISASDICFQEPADLTTVVCRMPSKLVLDLGDGVDHDNLAANLPPIPVVLLGGPGNDVLDANESVDNAIVIDGGEGDDALNGARFADTLTGGTGNDTLRGYGGNDFLAGGDGNDELEPDTNPDVIGNDMVDGGAGFDAVKDWYSTSTDPAYGITVTLDAVANDGRPGGEADNVISVERFEPVSPGRFVLGDSDDSIDVPGFGTSSIEGRGGNDTITGNGGTETIDGGSGDDRLEGGYGNDTITGGPGRDTIFGDETSPCPFTNGCTVVPAGNDLINARDGEVDNIDCGVGTDKAIVDAGDVVANCETVDRPSTQGPAGSTCQMPKKLKGLPLAKARRKLRHAHCTNIKVKKVASRTVRKGRVVSARQRGEVVTLKVSRGRGSRA